ncbi:class III extradiol ring-cleavage dioxygenase [Niveibacterium sp. SC-1]|uniref:DODA-type extradiol aromatic ring-opening family dioxygenase n=1 Tax=Niveibacterium sp. SC-1 TaxID=3135646 RepID=UPI00311FE1E1
MSSDLVTRQQSAPAATAAPAPLPVLFFSHGSPMHAIQDSAAARLWAKLGESLPAPRAILMVSAHWETAAPALTGSARPETIHDFGGFPEVLYEIRYPAPGEPALAQALAARLAERGFDARVDPQRGLDHGAWVPLRHMYPDAAIPVVQLSVQPHRDAAHHLAVGRALADLPREGVLVVASGHMTHNLRDWFHAQGANAPLPYAQAFRNWIDARVLAGDTGGLATWREAAPDARRAHPTPEHFLPLFVALGAAGEGLRATRILEGWEGAALAMDSYRFD